MARWPGKASAAFALSFSFAKFQVELAHFQLAYVLDSAKELCEVCNTIIQAKVMAQKPKRGRPLGGEKKATLSVRVSLETKRELLYFKQKYRRSLSREVESRLIYSFGRYGRPTHIANLADLVPLLAQSAERQMRGHQWDRHGATRELLIRAFTNLVNLYSEADVTPSSWSYPSKSPTDHDDPAMMAVNSAIFSLLNSPAFPPEIYGLGVGVPSEIQRNRVRNTEIRRRKK